VISKRSTVEGISEMLSEPNWNAFYSSYDRGRMPSYTIAWNDPSDRLYDITMSFVRQSPDPVLHLPAWRPGRYLIQNYAANVTSVTAADAAGESLDVEKVEKSAWRVTARAGEQITVRYRYYAGVLDAGSSFLDETEAYFNGSNLFMMVEGLRGEEARLTIGAPAEWRIETQLPREDESTFVARDYDHLIDSPVIAAPRLVRHSFNESGATIHLVFVGSEHIDTDQFIEPLRLIVREQARMFGGLPLREYRFLTHVGDRWHGVEHDSSCSIIAKRSDLLGTTSGESGYDHFLSIASHEFFHLWNVKRILPACFAPYDYSKETLTRLLWVMEGVTSYYGELTLVRAGLWDETRYLEHLASEVEILENSPGREVLSLSQASFDGWLANDAHDRTNALISFYNKGEVVAALLDLCIRRESGGTKSLDDVMLTLWREGRRLLGALRPRHGRAPVSGIVRDGWCCRPRLAAQQCSGPRGNAAQRRRAAHRREHAAGRSGDARGTPRGR
jgi:predicted metalloprotease with PDZ domain